MNVQITDLEVLVPIALAANLCDVNILARQLRLGDATCDASALAVAEPA